VAVAQPSKTASKVVRTKHLVATLTLYGGVNTHE